MSLPNDSESRQVGLRGALCALALVLTGAVLGTLCWMSQGPQQIDHTAESNDSQRADIRSYVIGYGLALALTAAAFALVHWPSFAAATILALVLALALLQMIVHFRFFLHINIRKSARDDLLLILFSTLIVILMVSGTLVILFNLRARMM